MGWHVRGRDELDGPASESPWVPDSDSSLMDVILETGLAVAEVSPRSYSMGMVEDLVVARVKRFGRCDWCVECHREMVNSRKELGPVAIDTTGSVGSVGNRL